MEKLKEAKIYLKNYPHTVGASIFSESFGVVIKPILENCRRLNDLEVEYEAARETVELTISRCKSEDEALAVALDIKNLLSLAFAHRIIFDRQIFIYESKLVVPIDKKMSDSFAVGYQIIHELDLNQYLNDCLNNWSGLSNLEKDALFVSINYINQTYEGFIEDRILRTVQAWESISRYWKISAESNPELDDLRNKIKQTYQQWKKENISLDPSGQIGTRLTRAIDQERLVKSLMDISELYSLDYTKLNIDFRRLIRLRDMVAHTGQIDEPGEKVIVLMEAAIKGLQIIFLTRLGYTGNIIPNTIGYRERTNIENYLVKASNSA